MPSGRSVAKTTSKQQHAAHEGGADGGAGGGAEEEGGAEEGGAEGDAVGARVGAGGFRASRFCPAESARKATSSAKRARAMATGRSLFVGVEGGASNTSFCLLDASGSVLAEHSVPEGTNGYLIGVPAVAAILARETRALLLRAGLPEDAPVAALGACMSGFLERGPQEEVVRCLGAAAGAYYIDNDSPGSIATAAGARGGCVIIAGTGCMSQLTTPDGRAFTCNGHGHLVGDEGSAWFVSQTAIRHIFRALDGYAESAADADEHLRRLDTARARDAMAAYFDIDVAGGKSYTECMYAAMYGAGFSKSRVAGFARVLADLACGIGSADSNGDAFCRWLFAEAGRHLGSFARTLAPHLRAAPGEGASPNVDGFTIVCVGSVWKSWDLLREGFVAAATAPFHQLPGVSRAALEVMPASARGRISSFRLVRLTRSSALGAAWTAARRSGVDVPLDFDANVEVLFEHKG